MQQGALTDIVTVHMDEEHLTQKHHCATCCAVASARILCILHASLAIQYKRTDTGVGRKGWCDLLIGERNLKVPLHKSL